jgi:branched-subunit amino acid ABC-type transport system permease component
MMGINIDRVIVFVILILFMLFRPQGLFGKPDIRKV